MPTAGTADDYSPSFIQKLVSKYRRLSWQVGPLSWLQLLSVTLFFGLFLVLPLVSVTYKAFTVGDSPSLYWYGFIFSDPFYQPLRLGLSSQFPFVSLTGFSGDFAYRVGEILVIRGMDFGVIPNTLIVAASTTALSSLIGFSLAFMMARYRFHGSRLLGIAILLPLLSTPFVGAIGLKRMITAQGLLNDLFYEILRILPYRIELTGLAAVILVQTLLFYPIVYLNSYAALVNIDPTLEEQAENLGASRFRLFRTITLPLATPGLEAGALLVFILSLEDLGTPIIFSGTIAEKLLTMQVFKRMFTPAGYISEEATALALLLLLASIAVFFTIRRYVSLRRYAMLSKGGIWKPRARRLSWKGTAVVYAFSLVVLFFAVLPHVGVILLAFAKQWGVGLLPEKLTIDNFVYVLHEPLTLGSILNSFVYSGIATVAIVVLGVSAAYLVSRRKVPVTEALDTLVTMPIAVPGIVMSTGLFILFLRTPISPLVTAAPLLIASYSIRKFPFTVRAVFSGLEQVDKSMEESAMTLGANELRILGSITVPLVLLNILGGGMLSFIYSMSEVSTSIVVGAANPQTAPMTYKIYETLYALGGGTFNAAALGVLLMVLQLVIITASNLMLRKRATVLVGI